MKNIVSIVVAGLLLIAAPVLAHVVVRPDAVGIGAFQTFTVSVPSEKEIATVEIRLALPDGLEFVTPTVKPGWKVDVLKHTLPGGDHPYEIVWSGGTVPAHFRDDFTFSAKVPATPTLLKWKAYQKYAGGAVVSWDLDPAVEQPKKADGSPDFSQVGPLSQTSVIDDLSKQASSGSETSMALGATAILIALASFAVSLRRR